MPATVTLKRGDTLRRTFAWEDAVGEALDLTGCAACFGARLRGAEALALTASSAPDDGITIDGPAGLVHLLVPSADTAALAPGLYEADLQVTWPAGDVVSTETWRIKLLEDHAQCPSP